MQLQRNQNHGIVLLLLKVSYFVKLLGYAVKLFFGRGNINEKRMNIDRFVIAYPHDITFVFGYDLACL
ncbi:hypothetical protein SDC9_119401 [bioreactor metagenome]|uniref:Uncharacterized protein n=1 Tax=bioreactor metagenome TaxID=1076179 RepID=A0A645C4F1_9ZZZZ